MARCFPYARDPVAESMSSAAAAVAEPVAYKLQKEREMMQKKERKKEKKRHKKAAQFGDKYETADHHSKHGHKKRKHEGCEIVGQETTKDYKVTVEHLEKSSLSEEHEAPSYSQALRCTPESSLDSSKRLRTDLSSSPSQTRNGFIRVKFAPTNQIRDPEATAGMSMKPRVTEQSSVKEIEMDLSMANRKREFQPHVNTVSVVKQVVSQQNMSIRNGNCLGESRKVSQQHDAKSMQRVNMVQGVSTELTRTAMRRLDPHSSEKVVMQRANPAPTKVLQGVEAGPAKAMQRANPAPTKVLQGVEDAPVKAMQRAGHLIPSKVFHKESTQVPADLSRKATGATVLGQFNIERPTMLNKPKVCADPPVLLNKPKMCVEPPCVPNKLVCVEPPALLNKPKLRVEAPVVKQQQQIVTPAKEVSCSVGSAFAAAPAKELQQTNSDRKSSKVEKKEKKLVELFVNWKASPIQMEDTDVGDQDWLFSCGATPKINCRTFDGSARCQPTEQLFSLQPRAVHLPDLNMYQLPFAVPF
ncbi:hypothetical protein E2562_016429 [Oryza meyeriana var. granulata]|uniref:Uncharacterized protein n=1 Tax=Oryza meyeriana var. granulata TaxID=110450 RepID=A0A6G1EX98_9ORYZ|nr:hypothetical protein E2562_016429 [Oryza meyeriana var. granulata]